MPKTTEKSKKSLPRFGEILSGQREARGFANQRDAANASGNLANEAKGTFESFSQQWLSRLESDQTGERIDAANRRKLRTLSYLLGWSGSEFEQRVGVPVGTVPQLEDDVEVERETVSPEARVRIPFFYGLSSGTLGFKTAESNDYRHVNPNELPTGARLNKLLFICVQETDLFDETLDFPIPVGAQLLVEARRPSKASQVIIARLERGLGVITQLREPKGNVLFRSYQDGGDVYWSSRYPNLSSFGVVRRVSYDL